MEVFSNRTGGSAEDDAMTEVSDDPERWSADAYCTSANYKAKKTVFLLFINRKSLALDITRSCERLLCHQTV